MSNNVSPEEIIVLDHVHTDEEMDILDSAAHAHMHELGISHSHSHTHDNDETHDHVHEHTHSHDHPHDHSHEHSHTHTHTHAHGDACGHGHAHSDEHKKAVTNRMARIIGHMQSVKTMMENDRDCSDILIQLSAIDSAVRSVSRVILKEHLSTCLIDAVNDGDYESIDEMIKAMDKFLK